MQRIRAAGFNGVGTRRVGTHIRAALLFGHAHADRVAALFPSRDRARVVHVGRHARAPLFTDLRCLLKNRHRGIGHRHRATSALIGLAMQIHQRRARDMRAGCCLMLPRETGDAMRHARVHQAMIGRVKIHLIDAVSIAVIGFEDRLVFVCREAEIHQFTADEFSIRGGVGHRPAAAFARKCFLQR